MLCTARTKSVDSAEQRLLEAHGLEVGDDLDALRRLEVQRFVRLRLSRPAARMQRLRVSFLVNESTARMRRRVARGVGREGQCGHLAAMTAKADERLSLSGLLCVRLSSAEGALFAGSTSTPERSKFSDMQSFCNRSLSQA